MKLLISKVALSVVVLLFASTSGLSASASTIEKKNLREEKSLVEEEIYTYQVGEVTVESNVQLSLEKAERVVEQAIEQGQKLSDASTDPVGISPMYIPVDDGYGTVVEGPIYRSYTNSLLKNTAEYLVAWTAARLPFKITSKTHYNWLFNKLTGWMVNLFQPTYVGSWITRAGHPTNPNYYEYFNTVCHYTDSTYKTPKSVAYWSAGYAPK